MLALGSPGGSRIPTSTAQVLLAVLVDRVGLDAAVERPRIHHQWLPDEMLYEPGASEAAAALERLGHRTRMRPRLGEVHLARRRGDGWLEAAADPRGPGAAAVLPVRPAPSAEPAQAGPAAAPRRLE